MYIAVIRKFKHVSFRGVEYGKGTPPPPPVYLVSRYKLNEPVKLLSQSIAMNEPESHLLLVKMVSQLMNSVSSSSL